MARYVYSTLSAPVSYECDGHMIRIEGGANIPNKFMLTPLGVVTNITDEEAVLLEQNRVFQILDARLCGSFGVDQSGAAIIKRAT